VGDTVTIIIIIVIIVIIIRTKKYYSEVYQVAPARPAHQGTLEGRRSVGK
jgi:hypothetical protein